MSRPFSLVVFGATGFTGGLICQYLARSAPVDLRWAIAGRSKQRLEAVRVKLQATRDTLSELPILIGDSGDQASVDAIVKQTKVLISAAGPFARYGHPVVSACARLGTHYVDTTGEPWFIRDCIDQYDEIAKKNNAIIVPACGFDCVPADLGAYMTVAFLKEKSGGAPVEWLRGVFLKLDGSASGGTLETIGSAAELPFAKLRAIMHPYSLNPGLTGPSTAGQPYESLPRFDQTVNSWVSPFILSGTNMRVVRRSAVLLEYGTNFRYLEANRAPNFVVAWLIFLAQQLFVVLLSIRFTRYLLSFVLPAPGQGPSMETLKRSKFHLQFMGQTETVKGTFVKAKGTVAGGDPGYLETAKMTSEAGLCLALESEKLPRKGGVLTTAAAFEMRLVERLRYAGMTFEVSLL